ncbi:MAG: hypothetical protein HFH35_01530 [Eubacterium sp.]|nr:hypothetical protein [Eubacterium sp.]
MAGKLVSIAVMTASLLVLLWLYAKSAEKSQYKNKKDAAKVLALTGLLGFAVCMTDSAKQRLTLDGRLLRNEPGEEADSQQFRLYADGVLDDYAYTVDVEPQRYQGEKLDQLFADAVKEAERAFIGNNRSLDHIDQDISIPKDLQNGQIHAAWEFSPDHIIDSDGEMHTEELDQNGILVMVSVTMTYYDEVRNHSFGCMVYQQNQTSKERLLADLQDYFEKEQEVSKYKTYLRLPLEWNGNRLQWTQKPESTYQMILLLGFAASVIVYMQEGIREQKLEQKRKEKLLRQYPEMVSKISLLLGAGMTLSGAWERIVLNYQRQLDQQQTQKTEVYEQMMLAYREMQDGMGELKVYERFGERCGTPQYRKLTMLIMQNLRKGSSGLRQTLEKEVTEAFVLRKNHAKKAGEEAGTKILIPMMLMLCIVMVIILVPAFLSIQM